LNNNKIPILQTEGKNMSKISVSDSKDYFIKDGKKWFYLADTVWTAFSNITIDEWEEYLDFRKKQGFNAVQIYILHQWDGGESDLGLYPFVKKADGGFDIYDFNPEYFDRARKMLAIAVQKGFTPALFVLWCDIVADTWANNDRHGAAVPYEWIRPYIKYVVQTFSEYDPIYVTSGDTDFGSETTVKYYLAALEAVKEFDPAALTSMHLNPAADLPDAFVNSPCLDFYMYQSGHEKNNQSLAYKLARKFCAKPVKRPVVNGEPCYEGGLFGGSYGRFCEKDVRYAAWQSLLSGAKAGFAYGAQGIWGWYKDGKEFLNENFGGKPLPWRKSLEFAGAWDASFAKWLFEKFDMSALEPSDLVLNETDEIRLAVSARKNEIDKIAAYIPYNADVKINMDLRGFDLTLVELAGKRFARPEIVYNNGITTIKMHDFNNSDVLIFGQRA